MVGVAVQKRLAFESIRFRRDNPTLGWCRWSPFVHEMIRGPQVASILRRDKPITILLVHSGHPDTGGHRELELRTLNW